MSILDCMIIQTVIGINWCHIAMNGQKITRQVIAYFLKRVVEFSFEKVIFKSDN